MSEWLEILRQNLSEPKLWPELFRKICNRFSGKSHSPKYLQELASRARPWPEILMRLYGEESIRHSSPEMKELDALLLELQENQARCPVRLGGGGHTELLYALTCLVKPDTVLETGVAYGWSSAVTLLGLQRNDQGHLYSSDLPYPGIPNASRYVGWVVPERLKARWTLLLGPDRNNLPDLLKKAGAVDLFHYDSDKSYRGRMWAYRLVWPRLSAGGVFVSDDIQDNRAFLDFCRELGTPAYVTGLDGKYIGLCRK